MAKLIFIGLLVICLVIVQAKKKSHGAPKAKNQVEGNTEQAPAGNDDQAEKEAGEPSAPGEPAENEATDQEPDSEDPTEEDAPNKKSDDSDDVVEDDEDKNEDKKEFTCNLKYKKIGCYADKSKKEKPLQSFIMSDSNMGAISKKGKLPKEDTFNSELPKFACKCANEAINAGNAIFGLQNIAECWTGPDDSKYDKDGASDKCVAFDYKPCSADSQICAGKKHANFVYYVDAPEHTKSEEEIQQENEEAEKKKEEKKKTLKKKEKKLMKKKGKKSKKSKKSKN